jgi:hypothetical protein
VDGPRPETWKPALPSHHAFISEDDVTQAARYPILSYPILIHPAFARNRNTIHPSLSCKSYSQARLVQSAPCCLLYCTVLSGPLPPLQYIHRLA